MIINKVNFPRKDKNMQLNNNQNSEFAILKLESRRKLELIPESSINNQQFVCREKKKNQNQKQELEKIGAALGLEICVMRLPQGWYLQRD